MDTKRLVTGTVVSGITVFVLGYLIFDTTFAAFYAANVGSAAGVARDTQLVWAVALGSLSYGALITLAIGSRTGSPTMAAGVLAGAVVGFLLWFTTDFIIYGITNIANLTRTVVDPLLELVRGGITGGVTALVLAKISESVRRPIGA
jgi:uncharacterized membrane protein